MNIYKTRFLAVMSLILVVCFVCTAQYYPQMNRSTPFEKKLPPLERDSGPALSPKSESGDFSTQNEVNKNHSHPPAVNQKQPQENEFVFVDPNTKRESYVYKPKTAFKLVVTKDKYPEILPDKGIYGVISLRITPDYKATSKVIYAKKKYRFDRLSWAIRTGWNETIPFFSRLSAFKKYLKPFNETVYAHFYIEGVKEYPEYPGQYYHWPREALEDYYLYILQKIDTVASQN